MRNLVLNVVKRNRDVMVTVFVVACILCSCSGSANEQAQEIMSRTVATVSIPAPTFSGIDQIGNVFNSEQLRGSKWIASFFFTSCQTVCPTLNTLQRDLIKEFGNKIRLVSISTDPDVDQGDKLRAYAESYSATPGSWWMLNLPEAQMRDVAQNGFKVIDPAKPEMHTTRLVAVDERMMIKGYYDSEEPADMELLKQWITSQL